MKRYGYTCPHCGNRNREFMEGKNNADHRDPDFTLLCIARVKPGEDAIANRGTHCASLEEAKTLAARARPQASKEGYRDCCRTRHRSSLPVRARGPTGRTCTHSLPGTVSRRRVWRPSHPL